MKASAALAPAVLMTSLLAAYVQAAQPPSPTLFENVTVGATPVSSAPVNVSGLQAIEVVGRAAGGSAVVQCFFVDQATPDARNALGVLAFAGAMQPNGLGLGLLVRLDKPGSLDFSSPEIQVSGPFFQCVANTEGGAAALVRMKVLGR